MKTSCSHLLRRVIGTFASLTLVVMIALPAQAQDTASQIRGRILDSSGAAVTGANVVVTDTRTSVERNFISSSSGTFLATGLPVGGPYLVTINNVKTIDVPNIDLGDTYNLTINLQEDVAIEEIITIGQTADLVDTAPGPSAVFNLEELNSAVGFNRDIKDVYSIDPRLNLDGFQVNCAGKHPRFNSITLDGVSQNDRFGLNTNGYATATGMPFPFDSIQQVAVELAPFDVSYGGFSACNVNAVTKSGSNDFEANVFYQFTNESMINDELDGQDLSSQPYDEFQQGFSVGGPIIKDRLFFFAAYEESESPRFLAQGYAGSGNGEERPWLSETDYNLINDTASTLYNYDTGGQGGNGSQTDEKYLIRLDYSFNADHQLSGIYNFYDGVQSRSSDSDPFEFEFANHYYDKGSEFTTLTFIYDAQWTDAFSTQIFFSQNEMIDSQVTVGPKDMGDHQISIGRDVVYVGADDSRQANGLSYEGDFFKLSGQYLMGDHVISGGYEKERLEVFNIFVQHSRGGEHDYFDDSGNNDPAICDALDAQGRFESNQCLMSGIDKFILGKPNRSYYGSAGGTNVATDAAALFENTLHSVYVQDEIYFNEMDLTVTAGLRYDWFASDDRPVFNQNFTDTNNGLRNDANIDGISILMPRLGFTWGITPEISLRGGIGLYSGGNPNVWLSNAWSNDGITNVQTRVDFDRDANGDRFFEGGQTCDVLGNTAGCVGFTDNWFDGSIPLIGQQRPGQDPTVEQFDDVANTTAANGSDRRMVLVDPDYKQPGEWKFSVGGTWDTPLWGIHLEADLMYTRLEDPAIYKDVSQDQVGTTILGQPVIDFARGSDNFMLSNDSGSANSTVFSLTLDKAFDWGLDVRFGYAFTEGEDVSPMTSFTAGSSWENLATNDPLNPTRGNSNYVTPHRLTLRLGFAREFFGDNTTRITLMAYRKEGQPASLTMFSDGLEGDANNRHLLYVPTGAGDPAVNFGANFPQQEFFDFAAANGLAGGTFAERNGVNATWSSRVDLRVDQEIPLFVDDLKARGFVKIYNLGNMLNSDWGRQYDAPFSSVRVVDGFYDPGADVYNYNSFSAADPSDLQTFPSLWEVRAGIEINFR